MRFDLTEEKETAGYHDIMKHNTTRAFCVIHLCHFGNCKKGYGIACLPLKP